MNPLVVRQYIRGLLISWFSAVHDQGWEEVCWCYALTTMLRSSMRAAVRNNPSKSNANILTKEEHHKLMRKKIVLNVYPFGNDGTDPSIVVKLVCSRVLLSNDSSI